MNDTRWPTVLVYSSHDCADCRRSKDLLRRLNVPYDEITVDDDAAATAEVMRLNGGRRTLPTIVIAGKVVLAEPADRDLKDALLRETAP